MNEESDLTADQLNDHYATVSEDKDYVAPRYKSTAYQGQQFITDVRIFQILDNLRHTAEGADGLPAWYLRLTAPAYSEVLAGLINQSTSISLVPQQWKMAIIHPVPKVSSPSSPSDYRPISVTPILSRMVERELVRRYLYPAFEEQPMQTLLEDQFAFRPTGSTTSALVYLLHQVTQLLQTNDYVAIISLDL